MIRAVLECCAGIDVGKKIVVVCVMTGPAEGEAREETRKYGTNNVNLEELKDWLKSCSCTHVVMESTGAYWKPIFNVLEEVEGMRVVLANSQHVRNLKGHKTDPNDSRWLAHLLRHGMIRPRMDRKLDHAENTAANGQFLLPSIMNRPDADSSRSVPVCTDRGCRMDESTPAADDRILARGELRSARTTG